MSARALRLLLTALLGLAFLIVDGLTQAQEKGDPPDAAKERQQADVQRFEAEFARVREEARSLWNKEPAKAITLLSAFREKIAANRDFPEINRDQLLRRINLLMDAYEVRGAAKAEALRVEKAKAQQGQQEEELPPDIGDLRYFPGPPKEDSWFPEDGPKKLGPHRSNLTTSKEERKIIAALARSIDIDLKDSTLEDVVKYLKDKTGVTIIIPQKILDDKMISYKTPVSVSLKNVTLRTVLKKVLAEVGLVYIIKDNVIQVTTEEFAKLTLTTRTYKVGDLLNLTDLRIPRYAKEAEAPRTIKDLIGVIVGTIEPNSWWVNGGPGRIVFDPPTMTLVVTQTTEVHLLLGLGTASGASPEKDKSSDSRTKESKKILSRQQLRESLQLAMSIDMENSTLEDMLKYLQEKTGVPIVISRVFLDEKVIRLKAPVSIHLKQFTLRTILRKVLSQVTKEEWEFAYRPEGLVITRPKLASEMMVYDVGNLIEQMPRLLPQLIREYTDLFNDLPPMDGSALLVRSLMNEVDLRSWETVEVRNKSRLVALACPTGQEQIADHLQALRRLLDVAVVMNARLYEVDRAFYTKHIAPLFPADKGSGKIPSVACIDVALLKAVSKQKLLLESDEIKLRPEQETAFLSQQDVFRYAVRSDPNRARPIFGTGLAGVSFEVRPLISPDRRYLRLQISQQVVQLVGIEKRSKLDLSTGKEMEVEVPTIHKTTLTGTVQIPDGGPILMPVDYRPPGKEDKDKVWLLVARPYVWIKEEEEKRGRPIPQATRWDADVPKDETPAPETRLPSDEKTKAILQAVLKDVLTNPELKFSRDAYGTASDKTFTLIDGDKLCWPKKFQPETHGYNLMTGQSDPFKDQHQRRVLGIRLNKFNLNHKASPGKLFDTPIEVEICNAGGDANGGIIGGCTVYYKVKRLHNRWTVEYYGALDP